MNMLEIVLLIYIQMPINLGFSKRKLIKLVGRNFKLKLEFLEISQDFCVRTIKRKFIIYIYGAFEF